MDKIPHNCKLKNRLQRRIIMEVRKYLEWNYNEDPTYENLNVPTKVALRGKNHSIMQEKKDLK